MFPFFQEKKNVLVLATNTDDASILLWCLYEAHHKRFAIGNLSKNQDLAYSPLCTKFYPIPENYTFEEHSVEIIELIHHVVKENQIDIIIPSGFDSIKYISQYKSKLSEITKIIAVPSLNTIDVLGNKYTFSVFCKHNDIPHPKTFLLKELNEIKNKAIKIDFPLLTKPLNMTGGTGIYKFNDEAKLYEYLSRERTDRSNALPILLQEVIPCEDIDFSGFARNGRLKAWTIQRFIEIRMNSEKTLRWLQFTRNNEVLEISKKIIEISDYSGLIHIDFRLDTSNGQVFAIEINPRFWASMVYSICDGVNFAGVGIKSAFNDEYGASPRCSGNIWGSPHRLLSLILTKRKFSYIKYALHHTCFQIKFMLLNCIYMVIISFQKRRLNQASVINTSLKMQKR